MFEQKHGTLYAYNIEGCRCDKCKEAKRNARKKTSISKHGTKWGYDKGCRCDACKKAKSDYWHKKHPNTRKPVTDVEKGTRKCTWCNVVKPLEDFPRNCREFLGRNYSCRICHREQGRKNKNKPGRRFSVYKAGAKVRKLSFDLSFEEFMLFWNKPCYYCGIEINGIGLDRKDSDVGYNINNIVSCCSRCNRAKARQTTEQFIEMCSKITKRFNNYIVSSN